MAGCCSPLKTDHVSEGTEAFDASVAHRWLRLGFAALIAAQSMIFGLAVNESPPAGVERLVLHAFLAGSALLVFILAGTPLLKQAYEGLRQRRIGIEHMFLLGIFGAFAASLVSSLTGVGAVYYEVVAVLVAIYTLGSLVSVNRRDAALKAADSLRLEFDRCLRLTCCSEQEEVAVSAIEKGDRVLVLAGQGIPVDGVIEEGRAFVQETALTGEPFPVVKESGDAVLAGSHVLDERLIVRVTSPGNERQLDKLISTVTRARLQDSGIQRQADKIIQWFMPLVMMLALGTFFFWGWRGQWASGLFNSLAVLVVACPCAMGLATPIGIWNTLNAFARRGLVVNTGALIERLAAVNVVVFDKTGTLSEEKLQLVEMVFLPGEDRESLKKSVTAIQRQSTHPVARAFQNTSDFPESTLGLFSVRMVKILPGIGIAAEVQSQQGISNLSIGNAGLLMKDSWQEQGQLKAQLKSSTASAMELWICREGKLVGLALLREELRESSAKAIAALRALGLRVEIMSGDRPERLHALGFTEAQSGLLPEDKAIRITGMEKNGARVLFVGDGVNDAPAMMSATAGIALASGADLTQHSAQARLYGGDLMMIPSALALAQQVSRGIKRNLLFAGAYNAVGIVLAMTGYLHPVAAALLMLASSLTVTWRALRFGDDVENALEQGLKRTESLLRLKKKVSRSWGFNVASLDFLDWALGLGLLLQGLLLVKMAELQGLAAVALVSIFVLLIVPALSLADRWRKIPQRKLMLSMLALGNVGMMFGWWGDVSFGSVVAHGSCQCGCSLSHMGLGKGMGIHFSWMQLGMVLASFPLAWNVSVFPADTKERWVASPWVHASVCMLGMLVGMWVSESLLLLVTWGNPLFHFAATYLAMTIGMLVGMAVFCRAYITWVSKGNPV